MQIIFHIITFPWKLTNNPRDNSGRPPQVYRLWCLNSTTRYWNPILCRNSRELNTDWRICIVQTLLRWSEACKNVNWSDNYLKIYSWQETHTKLYMPVCHLIWSLSFTGRLFSWFCIVVHNRLEFISIGVPCASMQG